MFCMTCQKDLVWCTCSDIDERLSGLNRPDSHVYIPHCPKCKKAMIRCLCGVSTQ